MVWLVGRRALLLSHQRLRFSIGRFYWNDKFSKDESRFSKVLVANRGEIACRIMNTCRRLGIKTVAVYSDIDHSAVHVKEADEAVFLGPAPAAESYLNMERILAAVKDTGAEAVHPGYGFLSENTAFAAELEKIDVAFVGPGSQAIKAMGDKLESKRYATEAGVSIVPGFDEVVNDEEEAIKLANQIGFPVICKALSGGGGKGMRICWNEKDIRDGWGLSKAEAASSFGDDRMLIEKFIVDPRHIEFQVICDKHGNGIYLNERECSIQRRNQKVIEEAPSTAMDEETRRRMGDQAVALAHKVGYVSAGTVEFLLDANMNFYFLEMNTRLQVEHPITELITGVDIVHQMLRIAKGHPLLLKQKDVSIRGWAFESRVYAEDATKDFGMPSVGLLTRYEQPTMPGVRCDSGVTEGSQISVYYDPMICKLITYGKTRDDARLLMIKALDEYVIRGVVHNIPLLRDILTEQKFVKGHVTTNYLSEVYPSGFKGKQLSVGETHNVIAIASMIISMRDNRLYERRQNSSFIVIRDNKRHTSTVRFLQSGRLDVLIDGKHLLTTVLPTRFGGVRHTLINDDPCVYQVKKIRPNNEVTLIMYANEYTLAVLPEKTAAFLDFMPKKKEIDYSKVVLAVMPGVIKKLSVAIGDKVAAGQELCVLEAMKMQNSITAVVDATVKKICVSVGETVGESQLMIELE